MILGVEGTAWNASAAVYDPDANEVLSLVSDPYTPAEGGIHPREASEHIASHIVDVVVEALEEAGHDTRDEIDAVAFSRGPGLGPCLRVTATAARAAALRLEVPLVGVNHTVAHVEMGRWSSGYEDPVTLDSAGANTLVTTYRAGRYRVLGETLDTGVGNALDKFARHAGLSHPGGPKLESLAEDGEYVELPYTVKGLDFSFSGVVSAAQERYDEGVALEDLAYSLQEHVFGALVEVSERALALTRKDKLVVGGGVSRNERLRSMLEEMCEERGARFHAPEPRFLSDNGAMIAVAGAMMLDAGETVEVDDSDVRPRWRPDEVRVTWRGDSRAQEETDGLVQGAEAAVGFEEGRFVKQRETKGYRDGSLDDRLRRRRTRREARALHDARGAGVPTPPVLDVDVRDATLSIEALGEDLSGEVTAEEARRVGEHLSRLHESGTAHGDPTTRNAVREKEGYGDEERVFLVDFGLSYTTHHVEDFGMDLHVFRSAVRGTTENDEEILEAFDDGYSWERADAVRDRLREIEGRGRYQ